MFDLDIDNMSLTVALKSWMIQDNQLLVCWRLLPMSDDKQRHP